MKVKDLKKALENVDDELTIVLNGPFSTHEAGLLIKNEVGGLGERLSFQSVEALIIGGSCDPVHVRELYGEKVVYAEYTAGNTEFSYCARCNEGYERCQCLK